jgi:hypothetical protein
MPVEVHPVHPDLPAAVAEVAAPEATVPDTTASTGTPTEEAVPAARPRRPRPARPTVDDETLAAYQAVLAQERSARAARVAAQAAARERSVAFRQARDILQRADEPAAMDPAITALASDDLAVAVHEAPEATRAILAALLTQLTTPRLRQQAGTQRRSARARRRA